MSQGAGSVLQRNRQLKAKQEPETCLEEIGLELVKALQAHQSRKGRFASSPLKFFQEGKFNVEDEDEASRRIAERVAAEDD